MLSQFIEYGRDRSVPQEVPLQICFLWIRDVFSYKICRCSWFCFTESITHCWPKTTKSCHGLSAWSDSAILLVSAFSKLTESAMFTLKGFLWYSGLKKRLSSVQEHHIVLLYSQLFCWLRVQRLAPTYAVSRRYLAFLTSSPPVIWNRILPPCNSSAGILGFHPPPL